MLTVTHALPDGRTCLWWPTTHYGMVHYLRVDDFTVAKLYLRAGHWQISIKCPDTDNALRGICEQRIRELTVQRLESFHG